MTNILRRILPNHQQVMKLHLEIEEKPFLKRYLGKAEGELTLTDHYRHLRQLKHIYDTFTELMSSASFAPQLPDELKLLLQRGANIQSDLDFLRPHVTAENRDEILPATKDYAAYLREIPISNDSERNKELLINFLVAILGDLNGGQFLKTCVRKLYERSGVYSVDLPDNGVRFYSFAKGTPDLLTNWLKTFITFNEICDNEEENAQNFDESANILGDGAVQAFTMQAAIVDELEQTRAANAVLQKAPVVSRNNATLFSCNSSMKVAAAVALTTGVAVATLLSL